MFSFSVRRSWPLLGVILLLLGSSYPRDIYIDERTSTEVYFTVQDGMFPRHWYGGKINALVEPIDRTERDRFISILNRAFAKYPQNVLRDNLDRVYALRKMRFYGLPFGGTNVQNTIFICDDEQNPFFSDDYIEGVFHHEFSSVLKRTFPQFFNSKAWEAANSPSFMYGNGGVDAILNGEVSMILDSGYFDKGVLTRYSEASPEEDMNVFAQFLFSGNRDFWEVVSRNIRIRRKANLLIAFYQKIDSRFNEDYFRHISDRVTRR